MYASLKHIITIIDFTFYPWVILLMYLKIHYMIITNPQNVLQDSRNDTLDSIGFAFKINHKVTFSAIADFSFNFRVIKTHLMYRW